MDQADGEILAVRYVVDTSGLTDRQKERVMKALRHVKDYAPVTALTHTGFDRVQALMNGHPETMRRFKMAVTRAVCSMLNCWRCPGKDKRDGKGTCQEVLLAYLMERHTDV